MIVGVGFIPMDVAMFLLTVMASCVQIYYFPSHYRQGTFVAVVSILRLVGWVMLSCRFGQILHTEGDIYISIPAAVSIMFLACGELIFAFNKMKKGRFTINPIENWREVLKKAWSVKFNIAATLFGAGEVAVAIFQPAGIPNGVFAGIAAMISIAANVARLLAQKELRP